MQAGQACSHTLDQTPSNPLVQGKWLGFRSAAAGDRFLQSRKRSPNRLVFFSQNVGTWEQWELAGSMPAAGGEAGSSGTGAAGSPTPDPDACEWASLVLKLRHRRLPQFELAVEVVRVGSVSLAGNGSATARSLLSGEPGSVGSAGSADNDPTLERRELKRMSGVLVHVSGSDARMSWLRLLSSLLPAHFSSLVPCCGVRLHTASLMLPVAAGVAALCGPREGGAPGH